MDRRGESRFSPCLLPLTPCKLFHRGSGLQRPWLAAAKSPPTTLVLHDAAGVRDGCWGGRLVAEQAQAGSAWRARCAVVIDLQLLRSGVFPRGGRANWAPRPQVAPDSLDLASLPHEKPARTSHRPPALSTSPRLVGAGLPTGGGTSRAGFADMGLPARLSSTPPRPTPWPAPPLPLPAHWYRLGVAAQSASPPR